MLFGGTALATTVVSRHPAHGHRNDHLGAEGQVKITVENPDPGKSDFRRFLNVQVGAAGQVSVHVIPATTQIHTGRCSSFGPR